MLGCAEGRSGVNAVVSDSAGVLVVENPQTAWIGWGDWYIDSAPTLDIGGTHADSNYQFFRAASSVWLADGRIVVANGGTHQLRFYDSAGRFLVATGREGGGPGEFEHVTWVRRYRGDSLVVFDRRQVRLTVFDSEAQLGRTVRPRDAEGSAITSAIGSFRDGAFLLVSETVSEDVAPGIFRPTWTLFRADPDCGVHDSVGTYLGEESFLHVSRAGGAMDSPRLFSNTTQLTIAGDRFYAGHTGDFEIRIHGATGNLESVVRRRYEPIVVTPEDVNPVKEQRLASVEHIPHLRDRIGEFLDAMPLPAVMPVFGPILVDDMGNIWVEEYRRPSEDSRRWTVFGPDGSVVAMLRGPDRFEPHHIGVDFLLGRWTDDLGEEHVRLYGLIKG
jgi:hypothetical protein